MSEKAEFFYQAFGLNLQSDLVLEGAFPLPVSPLSIDLSLLQSEVPQALQNPIAIRKKCQVSQNEVLLLRKGIGRFLIQGANRILYSPEVNASNLDLSMMLMGPCMGIILHQKGFLGLHGSAIATPEGAVLFLGDQGAGKSTLAGALHQKGYPLISDDLCALSYDSKTSPILHGSYPQLKLWEESIELLGKSIDNLPRTDTQREKYRLSTKENFHLQDLPLQAIYLLQSGDVFQIQKKQKLAAIVTLIQHTFRGRIFRELFGEEAQFNLCKILALQTPIFQFIRPFHLKYFQETVELLEDHFLRKGKIFIDSI